MYILPIVCSFLPPQDVREVSLFQSEKERKKRSTIITKEQNSLILFIETKGSQIPVPEITVLSHLIQGKGAAVTLNPQH